MPRYKLTLEYNGAGFSGWQKQPELRTIQGELEKTLQTVLRQEVSVPMASGRTDTGVHARAQIVTFFTPETVDLGRLQHAISNILKGEVTVLHAEEVPETFHPVRDSKRKQYTYTIYNHRVPPVLDYGQVWHVAAELSAEKMMSAARVLVGEHDFSSFRSSSCCANSPIKTIFESEIEVEEPYVRYRVVGAGFLKQMVRSIVGTLVEMGKGNDKFGSMEDLLVLKDRTQAGPTAPGHGLCLDWVEY